jgi:hypothetical protein
MSVRSRVSEAFIHSAIAAMDERSPMRQRFSKRAYGGKRPAGGNGSIGRGHLT